MFSFGGRQKDGAGLTLVITIGSARVTGSLCSIVRDETNTENVAVYYSAEAPLAYQERLDIERFNRSMIAALMEVSQDIQSTGLSKIKAQHTISPHIASIRCVFSAPWFVSQTRIVHLKRKKQFLVKEQLINALAADEVDLFTEALTKEHTPYSLVTNKNRIIDTHVIRSSINGYPTNEPIDKTGQSLSLNLYISAISQVVIDRVTDVLARSFHVDEHDIDFTTSTLIGYLAVEEFVKTSEQYLLVEINGEVTDTAIIEQGALVESVSFPVGTNSIIRSVQSKSKSTPDDIKTKLALLLKAKAERSSDQVSAFERNVFDAINEWREALYRALERISKGRPVPQTALLMLDPTWERLYLTALKDQPFELFTFSDRPFTVFSVQAPSITKRTTVYNDAHVYPLAILTGLMHRTLETH